MTWRCSRRVKSSSTGGADAPRSASPSALRRTAARRRAARAAETWPRGGRQLEACRLGRPAVAADWTHVGFAEAAAAVGGAGPPHAEMAPWHPGRCAELSVNGTIGHAGELHRRHRRVPLAGAHLRRRVQRRSAVNYAVQGGEITPLAGFPLAKEDVVLIVDAEVAASEVEAWPRVRRAEPSRRSTSPVTRRGQEVAAFGLRFRATAP